jgi:hypothetical protein
VDWLFIRLNVGSEIYHLEAADPSGAAPSSVVSIVFGCTSVCIYICIRDMFVFVEDVKLVFTFLFCATFDGTVIFVAVVRMKSTSLFTSQPSLPNLLTGIGRLAHISREIRLQKLQNRSSAISSNAIHNVGFSREPDC